MSPFPRSWLPCLALISCGIPGGPGPPASCLLRACCSSTWEDLAEKDSQVEAKSGMPCKAGSVSALPHERCFWDPNALPPHAVLPAVPYAMDEQAQADGYSPVLTVAAGAAQHRLEPKQGCRHAATQARST